MSVRSRSNWKLEVLIFEERGKPEYPEKNPLEQGREPTTNSTHIWNRRISNDVITITIPGSSGASRSNLISGVIIVFFIIILLLCFFGSRGKKKNAWYIYLTSHQPPPNLHNPTSAWPVMLLANQRLPDGNQIFAGIMSLSKSILKKRQFLSMFRWRFLIEKFKCFFFCDEIPLAGAAAPFFNSYK